MKVGPSVAYLALLVAFCCVEESSSFAVTFQPAATIWQAPVNNKKKVISQKKLSNDEDWYSDYNPEDFQQYNNGNSGGGRREYDSGNRRSGGGGHDYQRDTSRDSSNVDVDAVNTLLAERLQARKDRMFDVADSIRDDLLANYGVTVWDKEKTWRTGSSASGSGMKRPARADGGGYESRGRNNNRNDRQGGRRREPRDFGPLGHDYSACDDAGPIESIFSEDEIHALIAQRLQCKMSRNFREADAIQEELTQAGVYVHDGRKEWRADGVMFGDYMNGDVKPGRERGSRNDRTRPYTQSKYSDSDSLTPEQIEAINALVSRRAGAKQTRNYMVADDIRDELRDEFNVVVEDRLREWSVGGDFGPDAPGVQDKNRPYSRSEYSDAVSEQDEAIIAAELVKRAEAKQARDFDTADDIRDQLLQEYGVVINDRFREWSVGGEFGEPTKKDRNSPFERRGGGNLSDEDVATISSMVEERAMAKRKKDFNLADSLRDELERTYLVKVDDRSREWRVMTDEYSNYGPHKFDEETVAYIESQLKQRSQLKTDREYEAADAIRDELRDMGVSIDDRTREWSVAVDEYTVVDRAVPAANGADEKDEEAFWADLGETVLANGDSKDEPADIYVDDMGLSKLTVVALKEKLKEAGLPVSGNKAELIERLAAIN